MSATAIEKEPLPQRRVARSSPRPVDGYWICTLACGHVVSVAARQRVASGLVRRPPRVLKCRDCVQILDVDPVIEAVRTAVEVDVNRTERQELQARLGRVEADLRSLRHRQKVVLNRLSEADRARYDVQASRKRLREDSWNV